MGQLCLFGRLHVAQLEAHLSRSDGEEMQVLGTEEDGEIVCIAYQQVAALAGLLRGSQAQSFTLLQGKELYVMLDGARACRRRMWAFSDLSRKRKRC